LAPSSERCGLQEHALLFLCSLNKLLDSARCHMIVNNLWALVPPELPTPAELQEETQRHGALKVYPRVA